MGDMRKALYVFPDTNVFVQCQSLEELAWSDLGTFDLIVLLLSSPVIGEIDRQKGGAGRLAKRARTANTLIRRLLDEDSVAIKTKKKGPVVVRSEEHTSEIQSLMRISYAVFCLTKKKDNTYH